MNKKEYFFLNFDCFLVKEKEVGLIYDLTREKIYKLDEESTKIIEGLENRMKISELSRGLNLQEEKIRNLLKKLQNKGLGRFYERPIIIDKLKLSSPRRFEEREGIPFLRNLTLQITGRCNLNCKFCNSNYIVIPSCLCRKAETQVEFNLLEKQVKDASLFGAESLEIIGGEPLIYKKETLRFISTALENGYKRILLHSNLIFLDMKTLSFLKRKPLEIFVFLTSNKDKIHDEFVGVKGSFKKTFQNLLLLRDKGVSVKLGLVLVGVNSHSFLEEMINFLRKHEFGSFYLYGVFDLKGLKKMALSNRLNFIKRHFIFQINPEFFLLNKEVNLCWHQKIGILANGDIVPCIGWFENAIGNIAFSSIKETLREDKMNTYWYFTKEKIPECRHKACRRACFFCEVALRKLKKFELIPKREMICKQILKEV